MAIKATRATERRPTSAIIRQVTWLKTVGCQRKTKEATTTTDLATRKGMAVAAVERRRKLGPVFVATPQAI